MHHFVRVCSCAVIAFGLISTTQSQGQAPSKPQSPASQIPILVTVQSPPSPYSPIRDTATILSLVLGCLSLFLVLKGHKTSEQTLRARIAWDSLALLEGKDGEMRQNRHLLEKLVKDAKERGTEFDILQASSANRHKLDELARAYDMAGHLVKHRLIPIELLFDFYSRPIALAWQYLGPIIEKSRNDQALRQPGHMKQFEILAAGAAIYRRKKCPQETPYPIASGVEEHWKRWEASAWPK
jgi:hypothetical protein